MGKAKKKKKRDALTRLDLGCGLNKREGFLGVDIVKTLQTDVVHDLRKVPWPFRSGSVDETYSSHFLEHLSGPERLPFFDELWRVLKPKAQATFLVPYWSSMRAVQDPTHAWPPLCEASFLYFNREWRKMNKLDHYPLKCNFGFTYGYSPSPEWQTRNTESQGFAFKNYTNSIMDLQVVLTRED